MPRNKIQLTDCVMTMIRGELEEAQGAHGPMATAHEGYAVILEELDELWDEVKMNPRRRSREALTKEAIQVGAMAARFIVDICLDESKWEKC
jgi:hypothetical protein